MKVTEIAALVSIALSVLGIVLSFLDKWTILHALSGVSILGSLVTFLFTILSLFF